MASTALEEKIEKIRLRNEEIKRRYEEVEADKKNAAKLDALVKPAPVEDWPERKEPPEFSAPAPKHTNKLKYSTRRHNDQPAQYYTGGGDGKKAHNFGDGQGPPPDPKYNFLADSEREEHGEESQRDTERNRARNKPTRGVFRSRGSGRDWHSKEQWNQQGIPGDANRPDYEAWRAERNRIDEARISRQRTAEGNWRREWDNDKVHLADEISRRENRVTLGEVVTRQEHNENEKLYRPPRTVLKNPQHSNPRESFHGSETIKIHGSVSESEKRVVIATDRNIKVVLNSPSTPPKSSVMSVKVSPPNIAGTGRVGPRQRPRVMYSSQSEGETSAHEVPNFARQKSADEKSKSKPNDQTQKVAQPKSPHPQRKHESDPKSPYPQRKDNERAEKIEGIPKSGKKDSQKSPFPQRRGNATANYPPKSPRVHRRSTEGVKNDSIKSPRSHQDRNREKRNTNSGSEESNAEKDKSKELLTDVNNKNKEVINVPITQFSFGKSGNSEKIAEGNKKSYLNDNIKNYNEPEEQSMQKSSEKDEKNNGEQLDKIGLESLSNSAEKLSQNDVNEAKKLSETENNEIPHTSSVNNEGNAVSAENNAAEEPKNFYGEASGSHESKNEFSDDNDAGSSKNQTSNNCSANSGLNDSGFIELPSNDSIQDISNSVNVETSDFAETSVDSVQSENEVIEIQPVIENPEIEPELSDAALEKVAESSFSDTEKIADNSLANVAEKATKISQNDAGNSSIPYQKLQKVDEDSMTHSNVHKNVEDEPSVIEKSNHEEDLIGSEKEKENITSSVVDEEIVNISNTSKLEEKELEKMKLPSENAAIDDEMQNRSNKSEIVSENSNNEQKIESVDEKLKDHSINESASVSKSSNDINKEEIVEINYGNKKDEIVEQKIN